MVILWYIIAAILSYFIGSISCAVVISKLFFKEDVRNHGSNNAGATNMMRTFGTKAAIFTFLGDVLKGVLAIWLCKVIFSIMSPYTPSVYAEFICGYGVILGHMFPVYFNFKGGKGVATGLGVILAISFPTFCFLLPLAIIIAGFSGYVSLASIICGSLFPILFAFDAYRKGDLTLLLMVLCLGLVAIVIWNHRANIKRLLSGTENKFYNKKK